MDKILCCLLIHIKCLISSDLYSVITSIWWSYSSDNCLMVSWNEMFCHHFSNFCSETLFMKSF